MPLILMYFSSEFVPETLIKPWNFEILNSEVTFESNAMILRHVMLCRPVANTFLCIKSMFNSFCLDSSTQNLKLSSLKFVFRLFNSETLNFQALLEFSVEYIKYDISSS